MILGRWLAALKSRLTRIPPSTLGKTARRNIGDQAEAHALTLLLERRHRLIARNVAYPCGEIDLITWDKDTLVFSEVRARKSNRNGSPAESVTPAKQSRIRKAADQYLRQHYRDSRLLPNCRFDIVWVLLSDGVVRESGVLEGAF